MDNGWFFGLCKCTEGQVCPFCGILTLAVIFVMCVAVVIFVRKKNKK